jgi:hypothetical protein
VGEAAVVRSDDIDGNDVIGEVSNGGRRWAFRAHCDDHGEVLSSELELLDDR